MKHAIKLLFRPSDEMSVVLGDWSEATLDEIDAKMPQMCKTDARKVIIVGMMIAECVKWHKAL